VRWDECVSGLGGCSWDMETSVKLVDAEVVRYWEDGTCFFDGLLEDMACSD
jgi:hypothetical protein